MVVDYPSMSSVKFGVPGISFGPIPKKAKGRAPVAGLSIMNWLQGSDLN